MKYTTYSLLIVLLALCGIVCSCSDFEPKGMPDLPNLPKVSELKADIEGHNIKLSWVNPASVDIENILLIHNGQGNNPTVLPANATTHTVVGQPMGEENLYTVKVRYQDGYTSEGVSVNAVLPEETLAEVSNLNATVEGRTVALTWTLPSAAGITGVRVIRNDETTAANVYEGAVTFCELKGQPMGTSTKYTVQVIYDTFYLSKGVSTQVEIEEIPAKVGFLMTAPSIAQLPDDDERAAATWFEAQEGYELISLAELPTLDPVEVSVLWIMVDRVGLPLGWENLPGGLADQETIEALRGYSAAGGSLYLSNMATQLTVPLGIVPENMAPTCYGNGDGGDGGDVWTINPYLGWDFRDDGPRAGEQGFYDRTAHQIFKGITMEDPNSYGYNSVPLIGPGRREDHNCLWDCNIYGAGNEADVIRHFEVTTNSMVLATWGHVRDHCVAGLVDFFPNTQHGKCVANGFAAYEWNQNSGTNPYQHNIEQLTTNILEYLK